MIKEHLRRPLPFSENLYKRIYPPHRRSRHEGSNWRRTLLLIGSAAALLLVLASVSPTANAMSLTSSAEPEEDDSGDSSIARSALSRGQIQFYEENWYFGYAEGDSQSETDAGSPATAGSSQNEFDFDAKERAPGLHTEWPEPSTAPVAEDDDSAAAEPSNPALTRDEIQFYEDNWHLDRHEHLEKEALSDEIRANLEAFDRMERRPELYTEESGVAESKPDFGLTP